MRLAAQVKMGYYPTPPAVVEMIASMLVAAARGPIRIIDPCAGEGLALKRLGEHLNAETFGIELDRTRARIAADNITRCLTTDYAAATVSAASFSLLYLNPPYDWAMKDDEVSASERYERLFLKNTIRLLIPGGVLVYLIPQARLDKTIAQVLALRFKQIRVYRFPEQDYQRFKQIVVFGVLKEKPEENPELAGHLTDIGRLAVEVAYLDRADCRYGVPVSPRNAGFVFRTARIDPQLLAEEITAHGLNGKIGQLVKPLGLSEQIKPIMPLRKGHLAQLLACGMVNGVVFDKNGKNPLLVKGITRKEVDTRTEHEDGRDKIIETDRIVIVINAIDQTGRFFTLT